LYDGDLKDDFEDDDEDDLKELPDDLLPPEKPLLNTSPQLRERTTSRIVLSSVIRLNMTISLN